MAGNQRQGVAFIRVNGMELKRWKAPPSRLPASPVKK